MLVFVAAAVLSCAAVAGALLFVLQARGVATPWAAGLGHGAAAVAGLGVLAAGVIVGRHRSLPLNAALLCLVLALIGGVFMLLFRFEGERPPGFMMLLHALVALVGLVLLWTALVG